MLKNFILITGSDEYRINKKKQEYQKIFREKFPQGNITCLNENNSFAELETASRSRSLFGEKNLIICENFWTPEKFVESETNKFFDLLTKIGNYSTIICVETALDKRTKFAKFLLNIADVKLFDNLDTDGVIDWVINFSKEKNKTFSRNLAKFLVNYCGENLWNLSQEIKKLINSGEIISEELIKSLCLENPSVQIWDFLNYLSNKKAKLAIQKFRQLLQSGESVYFILSMLSREIRIYTLIHDCLEQNLSPKIIAKKTNLHPFVVTKSLNVASKFSRKNLEKIYDNLFNIEKSIKTGGVITTSNDTSEIEIKIERFIVEVCS